jgi:hypothetical protein
MLISVLVTLSIVKLIFRMCILKDTIMIVMLLCFYLSVVSCVSLMYISSFL